MFLMGNVTMHKLKYILIGEITKNKCTLVSTSYKHIVSRILTCRTFQPLLMPPTFSFFFIACRMVAGLDEDVGRTVASETITKEPHSVFSEAHVILSTVVVIYSNLILFASVAS